MDLSRRAVRSSSDPSSNRYALVKEEPARTPLREEQTFRQFHELLPTPDPTGTLLAPLQKKPPSDVPKEWASDTEFMNTAEAELKEMMANIQDSSTATPARELTIDDIDFSKLDNKTRLMIEEWTNLQQNPSGFTAHHRFIQKMKRESATDPVWLAAKDDPEKRMAFLSDYAKTNLDKFCKEKIFKETIAETEWLKGVFEPFDCIVRHEGGAQNPANITTAKNICKAKMARGPRFWQVNDESGRMEWLYSKKRPR